MAGRRIRAVRRAADGRWTRPVTVARSRAAVEPRPPNSVQLSVTPRGRAVALWEGPRRPQVAIGLPDGTWGAAKPPLAARAPGRASNRGSRLAGPTSSSGDTNVFMDRRGRATVAWSRGRGFEGQPVVVSPDPGEPWGKQRPLAPSSLGNGLPEIAGQRDGDLAVARESIVHGHPGVRIARKARHGGWSRTPPLVHGMSPFKLGNVLLGSTAPPGAHSVWALRRAPAGAWQPHPVTVSKGRGQALGPAVAIGPSGAALMMWTFQPAGSARSRVQASRFTP